MNVGRVFLCRFGEFFSSLALCDIMKGGTPCMGISPGRTRPRTHKPERERERERPIHALHSAALNETRSGRMSPKKCVFGCKGKITLFNFPKNPALRKQWMQFVFLGSNEVSQVCL